MSSVNNFRHISTRHGKYPFPRRDNLSKVGMPEVKVTWYDGGMLPERPEELKDGEPMGDWNGGVIFYGTKGKIFIHGRFHETKGFTLTVKGEEPQVFETERLGFGYSYEAEEVQKCLRAGKTESDKLPLQFSLELMELLCEIRQQIGLVYPQEIL